MTAPAKTTGVRPAPASLPDFLTVAEVAMRCRSSVRTLRRWIDQGRIPTHRIGRRLLVAEADLAAFLSSCRRPMAGGVR